MKICIHKVKNQVDVSVVLCSDDILKSNDVFVTCQLLQENDLSECPLGICSILECIEILLQCYDVLGFFINGLPDNSISSLTY